MDKNPYQPGKSLKTSNESLARKFWKVVRNNRRLIGVLLLLAAMGAFMFGSSFQVESFGDHGNGHAAFNQSLAYFCFVLGLFAGILGWCLSFGSKTRL